MGGKSAYKSCKKLRLKNLSIHFSPQRYNSSWWLFDLRKPLSCLCCKESWSWVVTAPWHPVTSLLSLQGAPPLHVSHLWASRVDGRTTRHCPVWCLCLFTPPPFSTAAAAVGSVICWGNVFAWLLHVWYWSEGVLRISFTINFTIPSVTVSSCHFTAKFTYRFIWIVVHNHSKHSPVLTCIH